MRRNLVKLAAVLWILAPGVLASGFHLGFLAIAWFVAGLVVLRAAGMKSGAASPGPGITA